MRPAGLIHLLLAAALVIGADPAVAAGRHAALPTAELLLDLARDHGLNCRGAQTPADVQEIRILLRAAVRLNPRLVDAHIWLHELAALRGDTSEASDALRQVTELDPAHEGALARLLEFGLTSSQTLEQRVDWLNGQRERGPQRPQFQAMVEVALCRQALAALDRRSALVHLEKAGALDPQSPQAADLRLALVDDDAPEARLRAALAFLQLNPFHQETAWLVGVLLDQHGFYPEATPFYEHALALYRLTNVGGRVPPAYLLQLSRHYAACGDREQAVQFAVQAAADPASVSEAGLHLHWLLRSSGRPEQATPVAQQLKARFDQIQEPRDFAANELAQAAWYYCTLDPQPQRALMLAEAAAAQAPADPFVTRVLGWAQAANLQAEAAQRTLTPIAGQDPYAAYRLARIRKEAGDEAGMQGVLQGLAVPPPPSHARDLLAELAPELATSQPAGQRYPRVSAALAEFDGEVLQFHKEPQRYLEAAVELEDRSPGPGEPWWAEFRLTNRASFPVTLGPAWMVNPVFLLSFELEGDRQRRYPHLLTVELDRTAVLAPGQSARLQRTVDLGPVRRAVRMAPQQLQRVVIHVLLDPIRGEDGQWRPGLGGYALRPVYLNRVPAATGREAQQALLAALAGSDDADALRAVEVLAELLGEQQRLALGRLNYRPEPLPLERLQQPLLETLSSESWERRARVLEALQVVGLDAQLLRAVERALDDPHWAVRLLAVRLLGTRQGTAAHPLLRKRADSDPDELVRGLAANFLARPAPSAATRPAP